MREAPDCLLEVTAGRVAAQQIGMPMCAQI